MMPALIQRAARADAEAPAGAGGGSVPSTIPSIVRISAPSAWTASIVHDFALRPFTCTVQAPQLLVSQPMWVPVSPKTSTASMQ